MVFIAAVVVKAALAKQKDHKKKRARNALIVAPGAASASSNPEFSGLASIEPDWWGGNGGSYTDQADALSNQPSNPSPNLPSNSPLNPPSNPPVPPVPQETHLRPISPVSTMPPVVSLHLPPVVTPKTSGDSSPDVTASSQTTVIPNKLLKKRSSRPTASSTRSHPPPARIGSFRAEMLRSTKSDVEHSTTSPLPPSVLPVKSASMPTPRSSASGKATPAPKGSFAAATAALQSGAPRKEAASVASNVSAEPFHTVASEPVVGADSSVLMRRQAKPIPGSFLEATANNSEERGARAGTGSAPMARKASERSWNAHVQATRK